MFKINSDKFSFTFLLIGLALGNYVPLINDDNGIIYYISLCFFIFNALYFNLFDLSINKFYNFLYPIYFFLFILFFHEFRFQIIKADAFPGHFKLLIMILLFLISAGFSNLNYNYAIKTLFFYSILMGIISIIANLGFLSSFIFNQRGRLIYFSENPNSTSTRMAIAFVIMLFNFKNINHFFYKILSFILLCSLVIYSFKSGSRGSFVLIIFSLIFYFFTLKKTTLIKIVTFFLFPVCFYFLYEYLNIYFNSNNFILFKRLLVLIEDKNLGERSVLWSDVLNIFSNHPFLGIGESSYIVLITKIHGEYLDTHNIFLYVLVTTGIIGLSFYFYFISNLSIIIFKTKNIFLIILFLNLLLISLKTGGIINYTFYWVMLGIVFGCSKYLNN